MKENDLISIVIPCYNDAEFIEQAIDSALNQTYSNKEVIVVDDGSNDDTKVVLQRIEHKIDKLITQENKGQSSARNNGIKYAKGSFILVLDSDDYFEKTFCEKAISLLKNDLNVKLVTCYANLIFENNKDNHIRKTRGGDVKNFLTSNSALGSAMFRKEDWKISGYYDDTMRSGLEDWEFYIRLLSNGGTAEVIEEPLYNYRKRAHTTTSKANKAKYSLWKFIFSKHKDLYFKYHDQFIDQIIYMIQTEERDKIKNKNRLEFRLGSLILKPLRKIKAIFK